MRQIKEIEILGQGLTHSEIKLYTNPIVRCSLLEAMWGAPLGDDGPEWGDEPPDDEDGWVDEDGALNEGRGPTREGGDGAGRSDDATPEASSAQSSLSVMGSMSKWMVGAWMRPTQPSCEQMRVGHMKRLENIEVKNVNTQSEVLLGSLWSDQPVVMCFLRKLG
eukprot:m.33893 g.33893  ORF g.33893 m.33893 type:complete len:164 (-) comp7251_c0_seq1:785-1276(-)